jgi:outer membrane protein assembly factor BamB
LIVIVGHDKRQLLCVDATDGKVLWQQETELTAMSPASAVVAGDMLIAAPAIGRGQPNEVRYEGWKLDDRGATRVWRDDPLGVDENISVTPHEGSAYFIGRQKIRVLDVSTGKRIQETSPAKGAPGSNAWLTVLGDRLLLSPEGQHGAPTLRFVDKDLNDLGPEWTPPNVSTTAYAYQPIIYPIVDGRLFVRGGDAIYCYDLRVEKQGE